MLRKDENKDVKIKMKIGENKEEKKRRK